MQLFAYLTILVLFLDSVVVKASDASHSGYINSFQNKFLHFECLVCLKLLSSFLKCFN